MKVIRYLDDDGQICFAEERGGSRCYALEGQLYDGLTATERPVTPTRLLAPLEPAAILGVGLNYRRHAEESNLPIPEHPVLFVKGLNTLQHPGAPIFIPSFLASAEVDYECELAVVIGKRCKNVTRERALDYVLGYTCANDVSARDWQLQWGGGQWCRGKFFDSFTPLGPCLVTADEVPNPNQLSIKTILNEKTVQDWNTEDMIFDVPALIAFLSGSTTLLPGTVILTGTPHGVGMASRPPRWLRPGDQVSIVIESIGTLTNPVALEDRK